MKYNFFVVCIILIVPILVSPMLHAQGQLQLVEDEEMLYEENRPADVTSTQALEVTFVQHTQNPSSKVAQFEMILKSNINSDRVRVTWEVKGQSIAVNEDQLIRNLTVKQNETYSIPLDVKPLGYGVTEVYGVARVVGADSSQLATVRKNFAANNSAEILPLTDEYNQAKVFSIIWLIARTTTIVLVLVVSGFVAFKKFVSWYKTDDREEFEKERTKNYKAIS